MVVPHLVVVRDVEHVVEGRDGVFAIGPFLHKCRDFSAKRKTGSSTIGIGDDGIVAAHPQMIQTFKCNLVFETQ